MRADVAFHMGLLSARLPFPGPWCPPSEAGCRKVDAYPGLCLRAFNSWRESSVGKRRLWIVPRILMPLAIKRTESHQAFWLVSAGRAYRHRKGKPITDKHAAPDLASENADLAEPSRWAQL